MGKWKLFRLCCKWMKRSRKVEEEESDTGNVKGALEILPAEMWTMILDKVEDFSDRMACLNTCQPWKDILGAGLFTRGFPEILPQMMDYLDFSTILLCRQVCSSWCNAVDKIVANQPKLLPYNVDYGETNGAILPCYISYPFRNSSTWKLTSGAHVSHLLVELKSYFALGNNRCPITGRHLRMPCLTATEGEVINEDMIEEHRNLSCELTKSMGHHVLYFSLEFDPHQITPLKLCQFLRRHLRNLPNLRLLVLDAGFGVTDPWTLDENEAHFDYLEEYPLPYIKSLESISFEGVNSPIQMQYQLLSIHGPQLKKVEMQLSRLTPALFNLLMNLTELTVTIDSEADIRNLTLCHAPLQKLSIIMDNGTVLLAEDLLEVIHGFPTLYNFDLKLFLDVQLWDDDCVFIGDQLENSSINCVTISIDAETDQKIFPLSFNFLKCFPGLEHLSMEYVEIPPDIADYVNDRRHQNRSKEIIEFKKYLKRGFMYRSNIWELLPELLTFSYEWCGHHNESVEHFYTRSIYNELNPPPCELEVDRNVAGALKKIKKLGCRVGKTAREVCIQAISLLI